LVLVLAVAVVVLNRHHGPAAGRRAAAEEAAREEAAAEAEAAPARAADDDHAAAAAAARHRHRGRRRRREHRGDDRPGDRLRRRRAGDPPDGAPDDAPVGGPRPADMAAFGVGLLDDCGPGRRIFRDMDRAAADDRTAAGASAEFRQSHSYRHNSIPVPGRPGGCKNGLRQYSSPVRPSEQMQTIGLSASALTILSPENARIRACQAPFVPLKYSFRGGVNGPVPTIFADHG